MHLKSYFGFWQFSKICFYKHFISFSAVNFGQSPSQAQFIFSRLIVANDKSHGIPMRFAFLDIKTMIYFPNTSAEAKKLYTKT